MAVPPLRVCRRTTALSSNLFFFSLYSPLCSSASRSAGRASRSVLGLPIPPLAASAPPASAADSLRSFFSLSRRCLASERPSVFASFVATRVAASGTRTQRLDEHFVYHKTLEKSTRKRVAASPGRSDPCAAALPLSRRIQHSFFLSVLTRRKSSAVARLAWKLFFSRSPERLLAAKRNASDAEENGGFKTFAQVEAEKKARKKAETKLLSVALGCGAVTVSIAGLVYVVATWYEQPLIRVGETTRETENRREPTTVVA
ncbi:putative transmembrane protein [Toxoplasma gondii TgCatPRC2]|uniref:Transmembrane protein n=9 Tax=Toxoplasma gondii TaxID=5811 RepID=A0A125YRZ1_TOXGG|nr:hypothetical protein TGME49_293400 [Toxoplasma gondii ME49]EPR57642.1 hypothetical protein TGGT1_293400 [Toxoplasma gondii GT1]ESS29237.1 putative transmembrane protein [Toxoplasma gondii VEG]KFG35738.1 putative transmembrane protein [Toxoplasma gondii p89]KFH14382.1 putative transmembrane protein [Toxoplasma gondii MAS]KYF38854.1 hypothetical protein TGARI_293400 [Toxoplasma gondii ARI]KYK65970.1 putative transmembrane protein [Toxoplasma gondii TgCatPRC2]PUA86922.1 putative transmembran|eukprot:XP_002370142.1 hypothetical protein TGME49_293400 [Toxoplasma gondii ME49]